MRVMVMEFVPLVDRCCDGGLTCGCGRGRCLAHRPPPAQWHSGIRVSALDFRRFPRLSPAEVAFRAVQGYMTGRPERGKPASASPSSRGPGHHPFTVKTRVRIPLGTPLITMEYFEFV